MRSGWLLAGAALLFLSGRRRRRADDGLDDMGPFALVEVPGVNQPVRLRNDAAEALQRLLAAARKDGIRPPMLVPFDGYRTEEQQARRAAGKSSTWVAHADSSEHRTGRGVDLWLGAGSAHTDSETLASLERTTAWRWMTRNARRFDFYPYKREPWHWVYGRPHLTNRDLLRAEIERGREAGYLT